MDGAGDYMTYREWRINVKGITDDEFYSLSINERHELFWQYLIFKDS